MQRGIEKHVGGLIVILISFLIIFFQFNEVFRDANDISFSKQGDGLKSTFGTIYHIKYDQDYWRTMAMNYPYGESVFFTGNQVFATNLIKLLKDLGWDLSDYALGILNIWLLFSFVVCAFFLYLIFRELELPEWISILGALIITFLSPQWDRLGGHYNLAYGWAFPITIYLLIRFYKKPSFRLSSLISLYLLVLCGKHLYFLVLSGILIMTVMVYAFFKDENHFGGKLKIVFHVFLQLFVPFIIFSFFTSFFDQNVDRTSFPWGFIQSTTRIESVFLPLGKPYADFIKISGSLKTVAFVGLTGTLVFIIVKINAIVQGLKNGFQAAFKITDKSYLNLLYWGSVLSLLISLGLPFTLGLEELLNYTGPFRQFRAVGRFIFPFYYMLGILTIYLLWEWNKKYRNTVVRFALLIALLFYVYDAALNLDKNTQIHINRIETLNDRNNELPINQWVKSYDWTDYQAIMPIPYFHVGSENYWINGGSPNHVETYVASIKTGLPLNAVMLSRTSIRESLRNIDLVLEPVNGYPLKKDLPDGRPFLLLVYKKGNINQNEKRLIKNSIFLEENDQFVLYKFDPERLSQIKDEYFANLQENVAKVLDDKDSIIPKYNEKVDHVSFSGPINRENVLKEVTLPDTGWYSFSFWFEEIDQDLWPRTRIYWSYYAGDRKTYEGSLNFGERMIARKGSTGLFEYHIKVKQSDQKIIFKYKNRVATKGNINIHNFIIRKRDEDILQKYNGKLLLNNRPLMFGEKAFPFNNPDI